MNLFSYQFVVVFLFAVGFCVCFVVAVVFWWREGCCVFVVFCFSGLFLFSYFVAVVAAALP